MSPRGISVANTFCILFVLGVFLLAGAPVREVEAGWSWTIPNSHSSYLNKLGYYHVVGEVLNTGDQAMKLVKITVKFYNANNDLVASRSDYTTLDLLPAGRKSPFDVTLLDTVLSAKVHNYTLQLNYEQASARPQALNITSQYFYRDGLGAHIECQIKNIGTAATTNMKAVATFYNSSGKVIGTTYSYSSPTNLNINKAGNASIVFSGERANLVETYALTAESGEYAVVPELPFGFGSMIIAIIPISILIAISRRRHEPPASHFLG
jgi:hypothetical protein